MKPKDRTMRERLTSALASIGCRPDNDATYRELVGRYTEPHRYYHNYSHIESCMRFVLAHPKRTEIELALWFHDAVYEPRSATNEEDSAELARVVLGSLGGQQKAIDRIASHILATKTHMPTNDAASYVIDIDLSILGCPVDVYDEFERNIRAEYAFVPEDVYRTGRIRVLESFLARPSVYHTSFFREAFEEQARKNLKRAVYELMTT